MSKILIVESNSAEILARGHASATGFVRSFLTLDPAVMLEVVAPYITPLRNEDLDGVTAVVFTGSVSNWDTNAPEAAPLRAAMERVFRAGLPVWGSCNGLQLASVVLGGSVGPSPNGFEMGLARNITLTDAGAAHPMMQGRSNGFAVPCMHRDEVRHLPQDAVLLASNSHSAVQAMAYNAGGVDFWGTQYHPELSPADVAHAVREAGLFHDRSDHVDDLEIAEFDRAAARRLGGHLAGLQPANRARELANWLSHVRHGAAQCPAIMAHHGCADAAP